MGAFFQYELRQAFRQASDLMPVLIFFILAATLFPLGVGPEPALLGRIASGVIWVTALLAAMLSLDRLFETDYADGMLEQFALSPQPLALLVVAKIAVHWLTTGLPLLLLAPALGAMLNLEASAYGTLLAAMALGTPCLSLIGALGAAVTLGARRSGALVPLLVLPLVLPVLIFGVSAVEGAATGLGGSSSLLILGALLAATLPLAPILVAMALRLAVQD